MPNFDYNLNIPDAPNNPSNDQPKMKVNTNSINSLIGVDHFAFKTNNDGYHQQSSYVAGGDPGALASIARVYSKRITTSGHTDTELFLQKASDDGDNPGSVIQLTDTIFGASANQQGFSWLPGGVIIQWGRSTATFDPTVPGGFSVNFPNTFPGSVFTVTFSVTKNSTTAHSCFLKQTPTTSGFILRGDTTFDGYFYIAIGK